MSFDEALNVVLPPPTTWKSADEMAHELNSMTIDDPWRPVKYEPYTIFPALSHLASQGKVRFRPAVRRAGEPANGYEYQRSC